MRLDGARSATRRELVGGTCATRVTRGTIDFQARDNLELRDEEFARNFHVAFKRGAPKVAFKQKLVPRVTRVAHVPRRSKIQARSPGACRLQGRLQSAELSK
jgi:hypothetical protein